MSLELIHTSVQKGLRGGSGFATAVATRGMPNGLERVLEELSAYDFDAARALGADRVDWAHRLVTLQGRTHSVLSRTSPCGSDWSGRPNRVAHHVVVEQSERGVAGPAWVLQAMGGLEDSVPEVEERPNGPSLPAGGSMHPRAADAWRDAGLDPGWAGIVAKALLESPNSPCYLLLPAGADALPLVADVLALIPADRRWLVTFSTRFQRLAASVKCQLRCVRHDASGLTSLLAEPGARQFALHSGVPADDSDAAEAGRQGRFVEVATRASTRVQPVLADLPAHAHGGPVASAQPALGLPSALGAPRQWASIVLPVDAPLQPGLPLRKRIDVVTALLFAIAGLALIISFALAVLIVLRS